MNVEGVYLKIIEGRYPGSTPLVRAMWETDPEVMAFVEEVSEWRRGMAEAFAPCSRGEGSANEALITVTTRRLEECYEKAWTRREPAGSLKRTALRTMAMLDKLPNGIRLSVLQSHSQIDKG